MRGTLKKPLSLTSVFLSVSFFQIAAEYSECPSGKKGGDLGWFPRGKMAGPFQEVAFNTPVGVTSAPFKSTYGILILIFAPHSYCPFVLAYSHVVHVNPIDFVMAFYGTGMDTTSS